MIFIPRYKFSIYRLHLQAPITVVLQRCSGSVGVAAHLRFNDYVNKSTDKTIVFLCVLSEFTVSAYEGWYFLVELNRAVGSIEVLLPSSAAYTRLSARLLRLLFLVRKVTSVEIVSRFESRTCCCNRSTRQLRAKATTMDSSSVNEIQSASDELLSRFRDLFNTNLECTSHTYEFSRAR